MRQLQVQPLRQQVARAPVPGDAPAPAVAGKGQQRLDAEGNPISNLDADGKPILELDADGNPIANTVGKPGANLAGQGQNGAPVPEGGGVVGDGVAGNLATGMTLLWGKSLVARCLAEIRVWIRV